MRLFAWITLCAIVVAALPVEAAPGGRLTIVPGTPVLAGDAKGSSISYSPITGKNVPLYDGTGMADVQFTSSPTDQSGPSVSIAGKSAGTALDVMMVSVSGVPTLCTTPFNAAPPAIVQVSGSYITTGAGSTTWLRPGASNDGVTSQSTSVAARLSPSNVGQNNFIGQDFGAPRVITSIKVYGPNDDYFRGDGVSPLPLLIQGSNDNSNWTPVFLGNAINSGIAETVTIASSLNAGAAYRYYRAGLKGNGTNAVNIAEAQFFGPDVAPARGLTRVDGVLVNASSITCDSDGGSLSVAPYFGTYLGSALIDAAAGEVRCDFSYGPARQCGIWNVYNQRRITLKAGIMDGPTTSCDTTHILCYHPSVAAPAWGPASGNSGSSLTVFTGLPTSGTDLRYFAAIYGLADSNSSGQYSIGIGWNSTTVPAELWSGYTFERSEPVTSSEAVGVPLSNAFAPPPIQGVNVFTALENTGGSGSPPGSISSWVGLRDMQLMATYDY